MRFNQPASSLMRFHKMCSRRVIRQWLVVMISFSLVFLPVSSAFASGASGNRVTKPESALNARNFTSAPHLASVTTMLLKLRAWWQGGSNLDTMRGSSPSQPSYQQVGPLPSSGYDDPKPSNTNNYNSYLTQLSLRSNAIGVAGGLPMQAADPTAGSAVVGGWSYNLDSGNYNFTLPVLGLAGRAGMNVTLALSYNSKVWTMDSGTNTMVFNGDRGFPAPGWRLGFGAIQIKDSNGGYYNSVTGKTSMIYLAPDGTRHDLALVSGTNTFKSYDSSYLTFDTIAQIMYFPNGTQVKYVANSYDANVRDYQALPIEIKDRNGNYITISYKDLTTSAGAKKVIDYVTDTAGRRIDFNYQSNRLISVSQDRGGVIFYYLRLDYSPVTMKTRFAGSLVADPSNINNTNVYFPTRITYPTGVNYQFGYTSYGQINTFLKVVPTITGQGAERPVAQTALVGVAHCIDLNAPENSPNYCNPMADLPRFTQRQEKAEGWMGATAANWSTTAPFQTYQYSGGDIYDPTGRRFLIQTAGMTQTVSIFAPSAGSFTKKDEATYTSDGGLSYLSNLRVAQTKATAQTGSGVQIKTTDFTYLQRDGMWLPETKSENGGYRTTVMEYTSYPAQYILGLPQQVSVYGGSTLLTRVSNSYDQTGSFTDSNGQTASYFIDATSDGAIQRDNTNYGSSFTARGNLTSVTQYSVVSGSVTGSRIANRVSYDTNGNVRAQTDAVGNRKQIEYADNYSNKPSNIGVTCAYPYTTADPTGFRAGAQWNYFTGQTIKSFNLLAGSSTEQQIVTTSYDFADRPLQTNRPDGGWVKTGYWDNWLGGVTSQ